ncbi:uncharacterized protein BX663DRAFT_132227 [Cokeromyces recurvatus]|uniref:uncharacterized protein n=1 Tax=Cokeromyces recurvatus TaxID=90255 RepID=UPI00221FE970|nr:uncharacterized protein BX663DRAFT_132227 [Cokeromyces recurvatus]KAI7907231.1 hypothetical protein BX663DRAFT_132227 [Cokeromyces recurvatus]
MSSPKTDVRRLLKKQQAERNKLSKVTHPFAKYDETGRLICIVCNAPVKSETIVWQAHLGSLHHRENIQKLKALKQKQQLKRPASPSPPPPPPSSSSSANHDSSNKRLRMEEEDLEVNEDAIEDEEMALPSDFFDNTQEQQPQEEEEEEQEQATVYNPNGLPVGFFDNPEADTEVQDTEKIKEELDKEMALFNQDMIEVTKESREVQDEDDELLWKERHLDLMVREQALFDSRVEKLKQMRRQEGKAVIEDQRQSLRQDSEDDIRVELKSSVREILKKSNKFTEREASIFMDEDEEEDSDDEDDWRAQQL